MYKENLNIVIFLYKRGKGKLEKLKTMENHSFLKWQYAEINIAQYAKFL